MPFCRNCGAQISNEINICTKCGMPIPEKKTAAAIAENDDAVIRMLLPVGRSVLSIVTGYLGLLSIIPFVGIVAAILGLLALFDFQKHPEKRGRGRAWFGLVMGVLTSLFWLVIFCGFLD